MHTDKYNATACALAARFNQIYLKLRATGPGKRDGNEEVGRGKKENQTPQAFSSFSPPLLFNSV